MKTYQKIVFISLIFIVGFTAGSYNPITHEAILNFFIDSKNEFDPTLANEHFADRTELFSLRNPKRDIVMLGDSITEGGDFRQLTGRDDILNRGIGWDTSLGLTKRLNLIGMDVKKCFILIGINDISRDIPIDSIFENYKIVIANLKAKNITPIIQSTLYTVDRIEFDNKKVEELNTKLKEYAKENNIVFIDLNSVLSENKMLKQEYTHDGVHLNTKGYVVWMNAIKKHMDN